MITPNYLELSAPDLAVSRSFYEQALGFTFTDYGDAYAAVEGGPMEIGLAAGTEPAVPLPTFETDDLDSALAAVVAAGGRVTREPFGFPGGRRFQFLDPGDNELAIYQPG
jgi:predicted enzyme related to lactoylglutathione lyase